MHKKLKVLMSGGGTGGHIYPAIAIAQEIQKRFPNTEFLFIGALGKMEMEKVPQAGFRIEGLNIAGFDRGNLLKNLGLPFKIISSLWNAKKIIKKFQPDFAIGTGGFASGPALFVAAKMGVPIFIQEQNSLPGKTNVFNGKNAKAVFTAYPEMNHFFPNSKVYFLGNPIRQAILEGKLEKNIAKEKLGLNKEKLAILSVGGSLGSRTINNAWLENLDKIKEKDYQLIWQTGKLDFSNLGKEDKIDKASTFIFLNEFIQDMATAYSAAIAISELAMAQKPVLLVPFPFAAEDHQTKNALNLVNKNAARMVRDTEMKDKFWTTLSAICDNKELRNEMSQNIAFFAKPKATEEIVDKIFEILKFS
jgi:UDP-N-acetylglucosamine--N-acetylmuramyl-(pentapeptide) pyrophosphoryl-undecaprenol N-acetylglucosamine transferase